MSAAIRLDDVSKSFTLHLRGGARLAAVEGLSFEVARGECVVLGGPSGAGKSSVLKMIYGNYRCDGGRILLLDGDEALDIANATPRQILGARRRSMAYVSQFLRVIPRVATLDIVAAPLVEEGVSADRAKASARDLLARLHLPEQLWGLPPATFSGGEQQRVNIARGLAFRRPLLLLDEPTASLDASNRQNVIEFIEDRKRDGAAILGIFHDVETRDRLADRIVDMPRRRAPHHAEKEDVHAA